MKRAYTTQVQGADNNRLLNAYIERYLATLGPHAFAVYAVLVTQSSNGQVEMSHKTIGRATGTSRMQAVRETAVLEAEGLIRRGEGRRKTAPTLWVLSDAYTTQVQAREPYTTEVQAGPPAYTQEVQGDPPAYTTRVQAKPGTPLASSCSTSELRLEREESLLLPTCAPSAEIPTESTPLEAPETSPSQAAPPEPPPPPTPKRGRDPDTATPADFAVFYAAYPRKKAPETARKAFAANVRHSDMPDLLRAVNALKAEGRERDVTPYPATFLRQGWRGWLDEDEQAQPKENGNGRYRTAADRKAEIFERNSRLLEEPDDRPDTQANVARFPAR